MKHRIDIIDLFAGIGGIRLGFEQAAAQQQRELRCVFTSEWNKFSVQTYRANFPPVAHASMPSTDIYNDIYGDITQVAAEAVPEHDILLAGFPCQPFSQAGEKKGFNDTRGTLFFDIERILLAKQPQAFLLENVKNLRGHDKGRTLNIILEQLHAAGYANTHVTVLKARDFGLAQNRERLYIVGFRDSSVFFSFPQPPCSPTRVGDILEHNVPEKYTISDKLWTGHQRRKIENKRKGKGFGYGLFDENAVYTNTLSARYYKDGSEILIAQNGKNPRKLTPRECARLQGFPESYILPPEVSDAQLYRQFGNSVPVNVVEAIALQILPHIRCQQSSHHAA